MPNPPTAQQLIATIRAASTGCDSLTWGTIDTALEELATMLTQQEARIAEMEAVQDRLVDLWQGPIRDRIFSKLNATEASVFNEIGALVRASVEVRQAEQTKELLRTIQFGDPNA